MFVEVLGAFRLRISVHARSWPARCGQEASVSGARMEILALFGWGPAKVDYANDPRLDEISYTQLKRWMLKQDGV